MDSYIEIILYPDSRLVLNRLLNTVYTKLHKTLCDVKSTTIGVSFPRYELTLGNILRLHGSETDLRGLMEFDWLGAMKDYYTIKKITPVPAGSKFRTVSRKQTTMSHSKLQRLLKRGSITEDEIKQYKAKMFTKGLDNPYLELVSGSSGHKHRRYLEFGALSDTPVAGRFD